MDTDPQKQSVLSGRVGNMLPACLFVFTACMTGRAKNVPEPKSCRDGHYVLSVSVPSCRRFHNRLSIFVRFFS